MHSVDILCRIVSDFVFILIIVLTKLNMLAGLLTSKMVKMIIL